MKSVMKYGTLPIRRIRDGIRTEYGTLPITSTCSRYGPIGLRPWFRHRARLSSFPVRSVNNPRLANMKPDFLPLSCRRGHQLADSIEDHSELGVIFPLKIIQPARQLGVTGQPLAQPDERAHHEDAHLHGPRASEHIRRHQRAVFGEGIRTVPRIAMLLRTGHKR